MFLKLTCVTSLFLFIKFIQQQVRNTNVSMNIKTKQKKKKRKTVSDKLSSATFLTEPHYASNKSHKKEMYV